MQSNTGTPISELNQTYHEFTNLAQTITTQWLGITKLATELVVKKLTSCGIALEAANVRSAMDGTLTVLDLPDCIYEKLLGICYNFGRLIAVPKFGTKLRANFLNGATITFPTDLLVTPKAISDTYLIDVKFIKTRPPAIGQTSRYEQRLGYYVSIPALKEAGLVYSNITQRFEDFESFAVAYKALLVSNEKTLTKNLEATKAEVAARLKRAESNIAAQILAKTNRKK